MNIKNKIILFIASTTALILSIISILIIAFYPTEKEGCDIDDIQKSIVTIVTGIDTEKEILTSDVIVGTGFCYESGKIITNYHNIQENDDTINLITYDDRLVKATVTAKDSQRDIALLDINCDIPSLELFDSDKCKQGQSVINISTPISAYLRGTYSEGLITNLNIVGFGTQKLIQTNIDLSPGCSGSPLLDKEGRVLGMTTFKSTEFGAEGLGFAIPANSLKDAIADLESSIQTPDLKIIFQNDIYQKYGLPGASGLMIVELEEDSPVSDQLQSGDFLIKINDSPVTNSVEYTEQLQKAARDQELTVTIIRDSSEKTIELEGILK